MQKKQIPIIPVKGMQKDLAVSQSSNDSAYEIRNMRIVTTGDNTSLCLTNEKSNSKALDIKGTVVGVQVINDYAIVFTVGPNQTDCIYKVVIDKEENTLKEKLIFEDNLNLSVNNPLETIGIYENEDIQKVYWVDGINQPRVINVSDKGIAKIQSNNTTQFDFLPTIKNPINVEIEKIQHTNGMFPAGVVQYAISYFNMYGQQSGLIYQSPLYYTSTIDRGLSPTDKSSDAFELNITKADNTFEYVRVYRIIKTSIDAAPNTEIVGDFKIIEGQKINIIDTGTTGNSVDDTELLYLGGESIVASTMTHKDNTLFLGNIELKRHTFNKEDKEKLVADIQTEFDGISYSRYKDEPEDLNTQYWYHNNLSGNSHHITHFQYGETYRIGIQFLHNTGSWSEVVYLGDKEVYKRVTPNKYNDALKEWPIIRAGIKESLLSSILKDYIAARLVCVYPTLNDRTVLCQGLVLPTVYNLEDRLDNSPYVQSSWFARPIYMKNTYDSYTNTSPNGNMKTWRQNCKGFPIEYRMIQDGNLVSLSGSQKYNSEIQASDEFSYVESDSTVVGYVQKDISTEARKSLIENLNIFGIDYSIVTFHSPELDSNYSEEFFNLPLDNIKFRVVGYVPVKTTLSDMTLYQENPFDPDIAKFVWTNIHDDSSTNHISGLSLSSYPFWVDAVALSDNTDAPEDVEGNEWNFDNYFYSAFPVYTWHRSGPLNNQGLMDDESKRKSVLKHKIISNLRVGLSTRFLTDDYNELSISDVELFNSDSIEVKKLNLWGKELNYYGNIDRVLSNASNTKDNFYLDIAYLRDSRNSVDSTFGINVVKNPGNNGTPSEVLEACYRPIKDIDTIFKNRINLNSKVQDPVSIKYKSSSHAIFGFDKDINDRYTLLPFITFDTNYNNTDFNKTENVSIDTYSGSTFVNNAQYPSIQLDHSYGTGSIYLDIVLPTNTKLISTTFRVHYAPEKSSYNQDFYVNGNRLRQVSEATLSSVCTYTIPEVDQNNVVTLHIGEGNNSPWITRISYISLMVKCNSGNKAITFDFSTYSPTILDDRAFLDCYADFTNSDPVTAPPKQYWERPVDSNLLWENQNEYSRGFTQPRIVTEEDFTLKPFYDDLFYFTVGELYRDNVQNRFGGTTESALQSNVWLPCGETVFFDSVDETGDYINIEGTQGDTYYQRYDHLKTYPYTEEDVNSVVDIVSFCVETRINIDGRYDRNRGKQSNLTARPTNFNLFNKVYSQRNNFFQYQYIDSDKLSLSKFPNQITWSKTKIFGEDIDTWTNITLASTLDLDGDKGELRSLNRFNNEIIAFQDKGISRIGYNERVQINASDGVPIEIANSNKVTGKVYISDKYGCRNKWSIAETPSGLYFIDDINKGIFNLSSEGLVDLTYSKNMYSWIEHNASLEDWDLKDFKSTRTLYDIINKDIYFTTNKEALAFNEKLGGFSSFYDYSNVAWMFNLEGNTYQIRGNTIWKLHGGDDYNNFFDEDGNYSVSFIANPEFQSDKIFDTLEFRTNGTEEFDMLWQTDKYPFDSLVTENEYQKAISYTKNIRKKFRIWRWEIGRDTKSKRYFDRIRNPWSKLTMTGSNRNELRLYDMVVTYYE